MPKEQFSVEFEKFMETYLKDMYQRRESKIKRFHITVFNAVTALVIGALGLIAALAWDEYLNKLAERIFHGESLNSRFIYAVVITAVAVGVTILLGKSSEEKAE